MRGPRIENRFLGATEIVFKTAQLDFITACIVNAIGSPPVSVTGLADTTNVDEIFLPALKCQDIQGNNSHTTVPHIGLGRVGVPDEANRGMLVVEAGGRVEMIEDIAPLVRCIQRGVDNGEIADLALQTQRAKPLFFLIGKLLARPIDRFLGERIKALLITEHGSLLVMVALDHRTVELADCLDALLRVGVVADNIAHANKMGAHMGLSVGEDNFQGMKVGMDIAKNCEAHWRE